jgi:hypothetical protein
MASFPQLVQWQFVLALQQVAVVMVCELLNQSRQDVLAKS